MGPATVGASWSGRGSLPHRPPVHIRSGKPLPPRSARPAAPRAVPGPPPSWARTRKRGGCPRSIVGAGGAAILGGGGGRRGEARRGGLAGGLAPAGRPWGQTARGAAWALSARLLSPAAAARGGCEALGAAYRPPRALALSGHPHRGVLTGLLEGEQASRLPPWKGRGLGVSAAPLWGEFGMQARPGAGSGALASCHTHSGISYSCVCNWRKMASSQYAHASDFSR